MFRTILLIVASMSFMIVVGGAVYEHVGVVPVWASAPPASLTMFQGDYALAAFRFWIPVHPVTLLLLLASLVLNWSTPRRKFVLLTIVGYIGVLIATFTLFVPELISITQTTYSTVADPDLVRRARNWELMSLIRLAVMLVLAGVLLFGLSRPASGAEGAGS